MILKILLQARKTIWTAIKNKLSVDFAKVGTHVQIGLMALMTLYVILTRQQTEQVDENTVQIREVTRKIIQLKDSVRIVEEAKNAKIDSIHKEFKQLQEITLRNDKAVTLVQKQIDALQADRKNVGPKIEKLTDEQMVRYMETLKIEEKK